MADKKGLPWFAWVGIGCGVLVILGVVLIGGLGMFAVGKVKDLAEDLQERPVYTAASVIARLNPEIELVDADEDAKTVTMRNVDSGEEMTFHLDDLESGNFSFEKDGEHVEISTSESGMTITTDEGTSRIGVGANDSRPTWIPLPVGVRFESGFSSSSDTEVSGAAELKGFASVEKVLDFYRDELTDRGFKITDQSFGGGGTAVTSLSAQRKAPDRSITIMGNRAEDGEESVTLTYSGKN